jgi:PAS domain S-box-containing protein
MIQNNTRYNLNQSDADEIERLKTLHECCILDTGLDKKYDDLACLAATIFDTSIALISFTDTKRQWYKSNFGTNITQVDRQAALCAHVTQAPYKPLIIEDIISDTRFSNHSVATQNPIMRFYAGFPIIIKGHAIGTLCIQDTEPKQLSIKQHSVLTLLAKNIAHFVENDKIKTEEDNLYVAMKSALRGIAIIDLEGNFIGANQVYAEKLGYKIDEMMGKSLISTLPESEHYKIENAYKTIEQTGKKNLKISVLCKDNHALLVNLIIIPKYDVKKNIIGYFCFVQNIENHKKLDLELQEAKNFQDLILKNHPDYVFVKDKDYKIVLANQPFIELYPEAQRDKVIGYTTVESYKEEQAKEFLRHDTVAFEQGISEVFETLDFPDKQKRTLLTKKVRFKNTQGDPFILGISRDVTEREDLIEKLEKSNDALDEFAYIAAHDLKEPIRGINNHVYLLESALNAHLTDKTRSRIERIHTLVHFVESLIENLLHFSRLRNIELAWQKADFNFILKDIVQTVKATFQDDIIVDVKSLPVIYCDKLCIEELLRNLITNAIKYNDKAIKEIEIGSITEHSDYPDHHVIYVKDNGIGIAPEFHDEIFRIFKRLHAKTEYDGGLGTGLTFVRKILDRHHGHIWLESQEAIGTTFFFSIPKDPKDPKD